MLWYIIDGWNLVNSIEDIKSSHYPQEALALYISKNRLVGSKNNRVTVVFDGHFDLESQMRNFHFKIIFSQDKSADDVIKRMVSDYNNKKQIVVITNDREIINYTRSQGANYLRIAEFIAKKKKTKKADSDKTKSIDFAIQREITEELKKKWGL